MNLWLAFKYLLHEHVPGFKHDWRIEWNDDDRCHGCDAWRLWPSQQRLPPWY